MLRVVHANRLRELVAALSDALPAAGDPFARPTIVVSGHLIARWVTFAIANQRGIAAHLELPFLEKFVEDTWTAGAELRAMDRRRLAALIASVLARGELLADDALAPVRDYLADSDADARQVRRVQLADRVASLLWEYALTRPEWLDAWEAGRLDAPEDVDAIAWAWQARLARAVLAETARIADDGGPRWVPTPRLPRTRRALGLPPPRRTAPLHVVGFSFLPPAYLDALGELAANGAADPAAPFGSVTRGGADVTVYAQDPCLELWEDMPGRKRDATTDEPRALTLWGRPARDTIGKLVELSDGAIDGRFAEPGDATALAALRGDILHRRAPSARSLPAGVRVLACPSLTRELEIVGSDIRRLLDGDPQLRANQIAVYAAGPDADRYLAQLPAIFGGLELPYHVVDAPLAEHGRVAEAALLLLELPLGRFARPELLRLMTHPSVLARHRHVDPEDWVEWAERLGIVHGASSADHKGTYLEDAGELFHWDQGIRRLALGAFMHVGDAPAPVMLAGKAYLPEALAPDQQASAATFALLARSMIADAQWLRGQEATYGRWAELLDALAATYLGARDDTAARELAMVRAVLAKLGQLDLDGREVGYREVVEVARRAIGQLRGDRGAVLAHGVLVAPLAPGRALPARHTFVVGLGEGLVPDTAPRSPLDLRGGDIRRGDVSAGDRDRYAFLECVLAPDDELTLSYIARDLETGDPLAPSSLVVELGEMLAPYLPPDSNLTTEHPLHRWDARYDDGTLPPSAAPARRRERHAIDVRARLIAALQARDRAVPEPAALADLLAAAPLPALRHALRLGPALDLIDRAHAGGGGGGGGAIDDAPITLALSAVRRFLETPAQAWARVVLRLDETDDEDPVDRADEPFATANADRAEHLRDVFARHLGALGAAPVSLDDAMAAAARARILAGRAPVGVFGEVERERDLDLMRRWSRELTKLGGKAPWRRIGFGRSAGAGCVRQPPITVEITMRGRRRAVDLVGWTEIIGEQVGSIVLQPGKGDARHALRGAFDAAVLAATGTALAHAHVVLDRDGYFDVTHAPWPQADAHAWLAAMVEELLTGRHAYLLGLKQVKQLRAGKPARLEEPTESTPGTLGFGPLRPRDELTMPSDADVQTILARRFAPLIDRMSGKHLFGGES
jgi:exodeoxyribonuclease V gamma subunit